MRVMHGNTLRCQLPRHGTSTQQAFHADCCGKAWMTSQLDSLPQKQQKELGKCSVTKLIRYFGDSKEVSSSNWNKTKEKSLH